MMRFVLPFVLTLGALQAHAEIRIQQVTSPGGISAWLVEEHSIPFTALDMRFAGGAALDAPGKRGATYLMSGLLEEGTGDMDARDFAKAEDGLAASYSYSANSDSMSISARFLTENRDEAVDLLRRSIVEPSLPEDAIARVKDQVLSGIREDAEDPSSIASSAFDALAYGDHPYGSAIEGTAESVAALTRDDLLAAKDNVLVKDRVSIAAVGDITPEQLGTLLDTLLGDLPTGGAALPDTIDLSLTPGVTIVPYDTPQAQVLWGQDGLGMEDPDFFAAYLLNTILGGGGFESRLMQEVREKRGLTYGVYSWLADRDFADVWEGSVASANGRVADAISVIRDEWTRIATDGVTEEELENAKKYMTGAYPLRFDGNGTIASILVGMQHDNMPIDYPATRNDKINAVTLEEINRVARERLHPDQLRFVVVGKPDGLDAVN
ncbi:insulinase family protein [Pseudooceanicola sediminis]|uniref:Insulinase family protein n=1 Tax=Pseudooceanicola sediminis TaxID=2211117 RepID=A0A399IZ17_9RHOB|nr:pitrilysin family protein [Pseudooceanicola sediminis]KAA2313417.1 insulinase family protein [Puniceibacterium sp. HSS470]RII38305.1 insulinase family protein [Pseudooceanicola sediminis]|tara:strand:+ start:76802 stop:78112 length:1311 start_codon:yes stop_codon:yes gene_type:complete